MTAELNNMSKKILILTGGPVGKLDNFAKAAQKLQIDNLTLASFSDINYQSSDKYNLFVGSQNLSEFDLIYFRVIGKRIEDATLVANYARQNNIRIVDNLYINSLLLPPSISKAAETAKLIEAGIPIPKTIYGSIEYLKSVAPDEVGFPMIVKSTTGKKAREVWSPADAVELRNLMKELSKKEKEGARFFAQEFVKASRRYRVFVLGGEVFAVASAPTKWRKRFNTVELEKGLVSMPTREMKELGIKAARAVGLDISGVDILKVDETGEMFVIEANAAPTWKMIEKLTGKNMAEEILKWLTKLK